MTTAYTSEWITESQGRVKAPHSVRLAVIAEVQAHCVKLDDGELYLVPPSMKPVEVGQKVIARVPWDGYGYITPLE
jgi:hypothetical protein